VEGSRILGTKEVGGEEKKKKKARTLEKIMGCVGFSQGGKGGVAGLVSSGARASREQGKRQ